MNDKVKIVLGGSMLFLFALAGVFGFVADASRKEDAAHAKKQLDEALLKSIDEQAKRSNQAKAEHETIAQFIFSASKQNINLHDATHKDLKKIISVLAKVERAALKKMAQDNLQTIKDAPADSEDYRRALHGASDWARYYACAVGKNVSAPRAADGGKAVADFYLAHLNELSSE